MACLPCQRARDATRASVRALVSADLKTASSEAGKAYDAIAEKAEALRVRRLTQGR